MTIESVIFDRLSTHAGLSALVSTRVYPGGKMPQNTEYPALTYGWVSSERISAMGSDTGIVRARLQVDVWAETYLSVRATAVQVRAALKRWSTTTGVTIDDIFMLNDLDLDEPLADLRHAAIDFELIYRE